LNFNPSHDILFVVATPLLSLVQLRCFSSPETSFILSPRRLLLFCFIFDTSRLAEIISTFILKKLFLFQFLLKVLKTLLTSFFHVFIVIKCFYLPRKHFLCIFSQNTFCVFSQNTFCVFSLCLGFATLFLFSVEHFLICNFSYFTERNNLVLNI
jgi:hypothetical protein